MAIEAMSIVYAQDFKADELEIGIVSTSDQEPEKSIGLWRVLSFEEVERHLLDYSERD